MSSQKIIAQRVCIRIYHSMPRLGIGGGTSLSKKEQRFIAEKIVKEYGGIKVFAEEDENSSSYNLLGMEIYVFFDGSLIRLDGVSYFDFSLYSSFEFSDSKIKKINDNIHYALKSIGSIELMKLKVKCKMSLPNKGMPYEFLESAE